MSIQITAFSRVEFVLHSPEGWCSIEEHHPAFAYASFPRSAEGIPGWDEAAHGFGKDSAEFIGRHCAVETDDTKTHQILDMSYGGYNQWREYLSLAVFDVMPNVVWENTDRYADQPFFEVVHFADSEGCIGSVAAARLAQAFSDAAARQRFIDLVPDYPRDWWLAAWDDFKLGAELASDHGLIEYR